MPLTQSQPHKEVLVIFNYSMQQGVFPTAFKTALVKPLKTSSLDLFDTQQLQTNLELSIWSTILEKLVYIKLNNVINSNNVENKLF